MVNEKLIIPRENIYKTEEVRYLEKEKSQKIPTIEEIRKGAKLPDDYLTKLKDLNANFSQEIIVYSEESEFSLDEQEASLKARMAADKINDDFDAGIVSAETKANNDPEEGIKVESKLSTSSAGHKEDEGEVEFGKTSVEGKLGADEEGAAAKVGVRADAVDVDTELGFKANIGVKDETGVEAKDGTVEADAEGFGVKVGKEVGLETPFGGASVDLEKLGEKIFE
ncbi:MAG: hypothetical protein NY202_02040 [Mollicutes bacterium UO1]